jgi:hypothetical protein
MKSIIFSLIFITGIAKAQEIIVLKTEQLASQKDGRFCVSKFSPDEESVLATSLNNRGLYLFNVKTQKFKMITDKTGAGFEPCFSEDGSKIYFRSDEYIELKKYSTLLEFDINSGNTAEIERSCRNLSSLIIHNNQLIYSVNGNQKKKQVATFTKSLKDDIYIRIEDLKPVLYKNGAGKQITPNGDGNYIWASLSPDQTKLLYNFNGITTYVCDLEGSILYNAGRCNAPIWINNDMIMGMNDKDDGYKVISSEIVYYSLISRKRSILNTGSIQNPMCPAVSHTGDQIVCQTPTGEIFIMNINIK